MRQIVGKMNLFYAIPILLLIILQLKRRDYYNPYDEELSNSSYYDASFVRKEKFTDEICAMLNEMSGYKRLIKNFYFEREIREGSKRRRKTRFVKELAEILLIHESGIFVINSQNLEGSIRGNEAGRYWIQSFRDGWFLGCRNYIVNPFMENKPVMDAMRWHCRDMPKLPFYSLAVFGKKGILETEGYMDENKWAVSIQSFPVVISDIMRQKRKFLRPEEVELVYDRLMKIKK